MTDRTVYFVSDGTGITAETFGNSILAQFEIKPRHVRRPFIDTAEKAHAVVQEINELALREGKTPIVFATLVNRDVLKVVREHCQGRVMDMFGTFIEPLEDEFGIKSNHRVGRFSNVAQSQEYHDRIEAINFSLAHDDGQSAKNLDRADVILVGVSRCGKTPTSLYSTASRRPTTRSSPRTSSAASCPRRCCLTSASASASPSTPNGCPPSATSAARAASTPTC